MTRQSFDSDLQELHNELLRMGSIVETQIHQSIKALVNQDAELAEVVIKNDDIVDDLQKEIEDKCIKLIAVQQPMAVDLRKIFTTTKIITDLERMADHAVDIAKVVIRLKGEIYIKHIVHIPKVGDIVQGMIKDSLDAYVEGNLERAYKVCKRDDQVDDIYKTVFKEFLLIMMEDKDSINQSTQFLFILKFLERIADHVTNICEWTIYLVTGDIKDLN